MITVNQPQISAKISGGGVVRFAKVAQTGIGSAGSGSATSLQIVAGANLGGHRAVRVSGNEAIGYASADTLSHVDGVVGITSGAVSIGALATVITGEPITEPSWNWSPGPVWLGLNGLLTQTPPVAPAAQFSQLLGVAISPTRLMVRVGEPIIFN